MKAIKFNLLLDGKIIRSLDEVKYNFNIDDIYDLYNKRILHKWLRLQNEHKIADQLDLIDTDDSKVAIEAIISLFGYDPSEIQSEIYAYLYGQAYREEIAVSISENRLYTKVIGDYHKNYLYLKEALHNFKLVKYEEIIGYNLEDEEPIETGFNHRFEDTGKISEYLVGVDELVENSSTFNKRLSSYNNDTEKTEIEKEISTTFKQLDCSISMGLSNQHGDYLYGAIKATVDEIGANYLELLRLDIFNFFTEFIHESPIVIMSCLMNPEIRKLMLENEIIATALSKSYNNSTMIENLEPYLQHYQGDTEGMWKYLGNTDKKYLVLNMTVGKSRVGEQSDLKKDFGHPEINGNYLILSGLTFKSASTGQSVYYLEV